MKQPVIRKSINGMDEHEHFVQFYDDDEGLLDNLATFVGEGFDEGNPCIVIATRAHIKALDGVLIDKGHDVSAARQTKRYITMDAEATLAGFMNSGLPNKELFDESIGRILSDAKRGRRVMRVFGEMVSLLWDSKNETGAILLEQLWNEIASKHSFTLFCAYPMHYFENLSHSQLLHNISQLHSSAIIPSGRMFDSAGTFDLV